jgi:hypothetical protein
MPLLDIPEVERCEVRNQDAVALSSLRLLRGWLVFGLVYREMMKRAAALGSRYQPHR